MPRQGGYVQITVNRMRLILGILAVFPFIPGLFGGLFWDDHFIIRRDGPISQLSSIGTTFLQRQGLFPEAMGFPFYRPIPDISLILNYALSGTNPLPYHMINVGLHLTNVLLAFELFRRLLATKSLVLLPGVALFAAHPMQCESVNWIASRNILVCMFFLQCGLLLLHRYCTQSESAGRRTVLGLSILSFLAALLSKEVVVALLPATLVLLRSPPRDRRLRRGLITVLVFMMLAVLVYAAMHQTAGASIHSAIAGPGPPSLLDTALRMTGFYFSHLVMPRGLIPCYAMGVERTATSLLVGLVVWGAVAFLLLRAMAKPTPMGLAAAAGLLFAVSSAILPLAGNRHLVADRYFHQSLWGIGLALSAGLASIRWVQIVGARFATTVFIAVLPVATFLQSLHWQSEEALWKRSVAVDQQNIIANRKIGLILRASGDMEGARECFRRAAFSSHEQRHNSRSHAALDLAALEIARGELENALAALEVAAREPALQNRVAALRAEALSPSHQGDPIQAAPPELHAPE